MNGNRMKRRRILFNSAILAVAISSSGWYWLNAQNRVTTHDPFSKWRPTRELVGAGYAGGQVCLQCHKEKALTKSANSMADAAEVGSNCSSLTTHQNLRFNVGPYVYGFVRNGTGYLYTVTDGQRELSAPILFCFGSGRLGQTYIVEHDGVLYESRISYYREIGNLDFTILHPRSVPPSLEDALGRPLTQEAAQGCFSCHTTGAIHNSQLQINQLVPGVGCEACHGPGDKHVRAMRAHNAGDLQIFEPEKLESDELTQEFCGACHRGFEQVMGLPGQDGINNIRYQPYRIFNSAGHKGDARISCVACHNPHDRLERDESFYDAKCLACHLTKTDKARTIERSAPPCPVSNTRCVSCHMPKIDLPGAHAVFTDHWIRVAKAGQQVPR
jgi:hypothetical protein